MRDLDNEYYQAHCGHVDTPTITRGRFPKLETVLVAIGVSVFGSWVLFTRLVYYSTVSPAKSATLVNSMAAKYSPQLPTGQRRIVPSTSRSTSGARKGLARAAPAGPLRAELGDGLERRSMAMESNADTNIFSQVQAGLKKIAQDQFGRFQRGMAIPGLQGKAVWIPFAIANRPASQVLQKVEWPAAWPYADKDFGRIDENEDGGFYSAPRFVTHIDDAYIKAIRTFYALHFAEALQDEYAVLDICSSWVSHYPEQLRAKRVAITGMNEQELKANRQATEFVPWDLNRDPRLPFKNNEFDFVTNVVSVDYLTKPQEVFKEMHRVMKPGGLAIISFSNRCFFTKAINIWIGDMNDGPGHCRIVGNYFHFSPCSGWQNITSVEISPYPDITDPVWVVTAVKANS